MDNEIWKDIEGFEGRYQVSSCGRVKSLSHFQSFGNQGMRIIPERLLKYGNRANGYMMVVLCKDNIRKSCNVHRLVAQAFIPNPNNLPQVNHIDENKHNNNVDNLEWVTSKENINHGTSLKRRSESQRYTQKSKKAVYQYDLNNNLIAIYVSIREAERANGYEHTGGISHCCNNRKGFKTFKGYKWSYEKLEA